jgi:hypothetical protein
LLVGLFQGYQLFNSYGTVSENQEQIDDEESKKAQLDLKLSKEIKRKEDLGFDITLIQSALAVHNQLELKRIKVLELFYRIGVSMGTEFAF